MPDVPSSPFRVPRVGRRRPTTSAFVIAVTAVALAASACGSDPSPAEQPAPGTTPGAAAAAVATEGPATGSSARIATGSGAVGTTGPHGETVPSDVPAERIVCLTGLCDDVLFSLGMKPVATSTPDLLALPEYLGDEAASIATIPGGFGSEDIESIAAAEPDLIIGLAGVHDQQRAALENFAPLLAVDVADYTESLAYLDYIGELTGRRQRAQAAHHEFEQTLATLVERGRVAGLGDVTALAMYWNMGTTGVNTSDNIIGSLLDEVFDYPWPSKDGDYATQAAYAVDEILAKDPQIIFMQSWTAGPNAATGSQEMTKNPLWKRISAVKSGRVDEVEVNLWTAGRGPRALSLVLEHAVDYATS